MISSRISVDVSWVFTRAASSAWVLISSIVGVLAWSSSLSSIISFSNVFSIFAWLMADATSTHESILVTIDW